jgi:MinD-like ATPase involved in chromosome partitioning or flagellar assembly
MAHIIAIQSLRGGVGKSNICANLAYLAARRGHRVAVLDTDLRSPGVHIIFGTPRERIVLTLTDFLWGKCELEEVAYDLSADLGLAEEGGALFMIPSSLNLDAITRVVAEGCDVGKLSDRIGSLIDALQLDFLFLDNHSGLSSETMLASAITNTLLLVIRPDRQDVEGTAVLVEVAARLSIPRVFIVVNLVPPGISRRELKEKMEEAFQYEVIGILTLAEEMIRLGSGGLFVKTQRSHPLSIELERLTDRLLEGGNRQQKLSDVGLDPCRL